MNYFAKGFGVDVFQVWAAERKEKSLARLHITKEERERVDSFCSDVKGDAYEPDCRLFSQLWFNAPMVRLSESQTMGGGKSYTYFFTPESPNPVMKCGHAIELATVFNHPEMTFDMGRSFDETFGKILRRMWIQFAKTGNPSLSENISPDGKAYEWPLYELQEKKVMVFDEFNIHPAKESEVNIVDWDRTYFLSRRYCI